MEYSLNDLTYELKSFLVYENSLYVDDSRIRDAGKGVYSSIDIPAGRIIAEYRGKHFTPSKIFSAATNSYVYQTGNGVRINPYPGTIARYINDIVDVESSRRRGIIVRYPDLRYNVNWLEVFDPAEDDLNNIRVFIESIRPIEEGEELYIDYGDSYWMYVLKLNTLSGLELQRRIIEKQRSNERRSSQSLI